MFKPGEYYKFIDKDHLHHCKMHICTCENKFNTSDFFSFMTHDHVDEDMYFFIGYELHECSMHLWNVHLACFLFKGKSYCFRTFKEDYSWDKLMQDLNEIEQVSDELNGYFHNNYNPSRGKNIEELMKKINL